MSFQSEIIETPNFARVVADEIHASISDVLDSKDQCSIVLSGGKTPASIYRLLGRPPRVNSIDWPKVHLFWGDERWVPKDDLHSNYRLVHETLIAHIDNKPVVHAVDTTLGTSAAGAKAYQEAIINQCGVEPEFDIVLLGVGTDGHTASLFPGAAELHNTTDLCFAVRHENVDVDRITLGPKAFLKAKKIFYIVSGQGKAEIVKKVFEGEDDLDHLPAQIYRKAKGSVTVFLDSASGSLLKKS
ncbi:MAG: 6-phosphogluconolactonase [Deltaproteobacteria bacterium]|nr:6-phosphogluconolactonase [Deltaproteobacteria bacterium]